MRPTHPLEPLALLAVLAPVLWISLGCGIVPIGCGSAEPPDQVSASLSPPSPADAGEPGGSSEAGGLGETGETGGAQTADTAAPVVSDCPEVEPSASLWWLDEGELIPPTDEIVVDYGVSCSVGGLWIGVVAEGLQPGAVEVAWSLAVDGAQPLSGTATWQLGCGPAGEAPQRGSLFVDLPLSADGAAVVLDVVMIDALGTEVEASHTFVAYVVED